MKTTLSQIRSHYPCQTGWKKLLAALGKTAPDDEPLPLLTVLESNGLWDALWCLRAVRGHEKEKRLLAVALASRVQHLVSDPRSIAALDVAERYANGQASDAELESARYAACAAAEAATEAAAAYAAYSARYAAYSAADVSADAATNAARYAAYAERNAAYAEANSADEMACIMRDILTTAN